jgi:hypothetical protein
VANATTIPPFPELFRHVTAARLAEFESRARAVHDPMLAAGLPGLTLRDDRSASIAATVLFANWLAFLGEDASSDQRAQGRK